MAEVVEAPATAGIRRFSTAQIIEHWIQVIAFVVLAVTGIPQRYAGAAPSRWIIDTLGGIETTRVIHRAFAVLLMLAVVYHFAAVGYRKFVQRQPREMIPDMNDLRAIGGSVGHAIGLRRHPPRQGRFTWEEKAEYWALIWGTVVMIITGFLLWNPIATTSILPGDFIPAAKEAHSGEALLAVLAVIVWHMYHVHVRTLNRSMFTGHMSREEMEEEHPLELESIDAGDTRGITDPEELRRRSRLYFPAAVAGSAILLIGIYFFATFESTAITTIEPIEQPQVFAPIETTTTIPSATTTTTLPASTTTTTVPAAPSWDGAVAAFFDPACTSCHGDANQTAGLNLASYDAAVAGGEDGPGIVPGSPDESVIVQVMESGAHPVLLDAEQLSILREWIAAGAPEMPGEVVEPPAAADTWDSAVGALFGNCLACHGDANQTSGLNLASYDAAVAGGEDGPGIVPGSPGDSVIVQVMESGAHPALLAPEDLDRLTAWIAAGAPETADDVDEPPPATTTTTTLAEAFTWDDDFGEVFAQRCTSCHNGDDLVGGLDLTSYQGALAGGNSGPAVVPGDVAASVVYGILEAGDHPAVLSDDLLAALEAWIEAGAPES
jgi:formate dehydrogenase gamma subunit